MPWDFRINKQSVYVAREVLDQGCKTHPAEIPGRCSSPSPYTTVAWKKLAPISSTLRTNTTLQEWSLNKSHAMLRDNPYGVTWHGMAWLRPLSPGLILKV